MDIKQLKKLIDQEVSRKKLQEATNPGTPRAKIKAKEKEKEVDPNAPTVLKKDKIKDPSSEIPSSKQPKSKYQMENPQDYFRGILRLHNALRDKFQLQLQDEEVYELIREITSEEIEKLRTKFPNMDIGGNLG